MKMKVWWIPQVPMSPFEVEVCGVSEGVKIMEVLAEYDAFQFANNIKPDYCNMGGLSVFDPDDKEDGPDGSWISWFDEETGEDDPVAFVASLEKAA